MNGKRWAFWIAVTVLLVIPWTIGMARMLTAVSRAQRTTAPTVTDARPMPIATPGATATAEAFIAEYLTYDPKDSAAIAARTERLRAYIATGLYAGLIPTSETHAQRAVQTWTHGYRNASADGTAGTIIVQALVYGNGGMRSLYLAVPVATDAEGRWAINGYPQFVAAPGRALVYAQAPSGEPLPDPEGTMRAFVTGFVRAYIGGQHSDIVVYMAPETTTPVGLAGTMKAQFREINEFRLIQTAANTARADVIATVVDQDSSAAYRQHYRITLRHGGGRWSVVRLD